MQNVLYNAEYLIQPADYMVQTHCMMQTVLYNVDYMI